MKVLVAVSPHRFADFAADSPELFEMAESIDDVIEAIENRPGYWSGVITEFLPESSPATLRYREEDDTAVDRSGIHLMQRVRELQGGRDLPLLAFVDGVSTWGHDAVFAALASRLFGSGVVDATSWTTPRGRDLIDLVRAGAAVMEDPSWSAADDAAQAIALTWAKIQTIKSRTSEPTLLPNVVIWFRTLVRAQHRYGVAHTRLLRIWSARRLPGRPVTKPTMRKRVIATANALIPLAEYFWRDSWQPMPENFEQYWEASEYQNGPMAFIDTARIFYYFEESEELWITLTSSLSADELYELNLGEKEMALIRSAAEHFPAHGTADAVV